jgi:hypothetical protein
MKRSIPRGANIGPSSGRTGEILVSRKVGGTSLAERERQLASRPDKNFLTGRPVGVLELYSLLSGSFVQRNRSPMDL